MPLLEFPQYKQCYVLGRRIHHGAVGLGVVALGLRRRVPWMMYCGMVALVHDIKDFPFAPVRRQHG